jgi:hypothetical protein
MALRAAMAGSGMGLEPAPVPGQGPARVGRRPGRRTVITRGKVGVSLGIGAAAAAVALVATSAPQPAATASRSASASRAPSAKPSSTTSPVVNSRLMAVADVIKSHEGPLPGNASLIIRTQTNSNNTPVVNYDLYPDSGDYYWGMTRALFWKRSPATRTCPVASMPVRWRRRSMPRPATSPLPACG